jgi:hypothetical protein
MVVTERAGIPREKRMPILWILNMIWTTKDDDRLRKLWEAGKTGSEIGAIMGNSRSSILARARRINLPSRQPTGGKPPKPRNPAIHYNWEQRAEVANKLYGTGKALIDLKTSECHWPVGDIKSGLTFCGAAAKPGKPYCEKHHACATKPSSSQGLALSRLP